MVDEAHEDKDMRIRVKLKKGFVWCTIKKAAQMQAKNTQDAEYGSLPADEVSKPWGHGCRHQGQQLLFQPGELEGPFFSMTSDHNPFDSLGHVAAVLSFMLIFHEQQNTPKG